MRIGVDLGGTKIEVVGLEGGGKIVARTRVSTPQSEGYSAVVDTIVCAIEEVERQAGETGTVGIGHPGSLSPKTGKMRNSNTLCLNGRALKSDLSGRLGREVRMANDADCFTLSEATDGAAAGVDVVFGIIVGTGTGGGVAISGQLLGGRNGIAGEWGHNPLPWPGEAEQPGPDCYCGKRGCIETWLSGPGLARDHKAHGGGGHVTAGGELSAEQVAALARSGDVTAQATLERYVDRFARATASIINVLDPHVIVVGGGLSKLGIVYERVPALWLDHVFSDTLCTEIVAAAHGDASGVRGAAWLWPTST